MDIASYSSDSRAVIKNAQEVASTFRHPEIYVEHLLIAIVRSETAEVESILNSLGKTPAFVEAMAEEYLKDQSNRTSAPKNVAISPAVQQVLSQALDEKARLYDALVEPEHLLIAVFDPKSDLSPRVREQVGVTKEEMYRAIADSKSVEEIASKTSTTQDASASGSAESGKQVTGTLRYCTDMTNQAAGGQFDPVIGRSKEIQQTIQILLRRRKNSPVLVGGAGVGKSAIVEGFAQAVVDGNVPRVLSDVKVMELDIGSMVAGAKYKGEFEERFKTLIGEVVKSAGRIILFIDEIHMIAGAGNTGGGMDAANLLKPALARGQVRLIGATTEEEYTKYIEKDKALERRFEKVKIEQPSFDDAVRIVAGVLGKYQEHHGIDYDTESVSGAVRYAIRYLSERNLPDVALDVIDEAGSEFAVKEEYAETAVPKIEEQIKTVKELIAKCEKAKAADDSEEMEEVRTAFDTLSRQLDQLQDYWGHRAETPQEVK